MSHSDEFKALFREGYGRYAKTPPDYSRCPVGVSTGRAEGGSKQCSRKGGNGPHMAYCKQHDPEAKKAVEEARYFAWRAESGRNKRRRDFQKDCITAIREIAAGHNDPRRLAQSIIDKLGDPEDTPND